MVANKPASDRATTSVPVESIDRLVSGATLYWAEKKKTPQAIKEMQEIAAYVLDRRKEGITARVGQSPRPLQGSDEEYGFLNYTNALVYSRDSASAEWANLNNQANRRGVINYIRYGRRFS